MPIIGINGEIASGKSTVADYLANKYSMKQYAFAKPLKDVAVTLGFEPRQVFGTQEEKLEVNKFWGVSGREFLQKFGSEVCRDYVPKILPAMRFNDATMWVRLFEKYRADNPDSFIVVNDVRFADESAKIKELGGYVIRLVRTEDEHAIGKDESTVDVEMTADVAADVDDGVCGVAAGINNMTIDTAHHQSELQADLIKPNIVIRNNGSLSQLFDRVETALKYINSGWLKDPSAVLYL